MYQSKAYKNPSKSKITSKPKITRFSDSVPLCPPFVSNGKTPSSSHSSRIVNSKRNKLTLEWPTYILNWYGRHQHGLATFAWWVVGLVCVVGVQHVHKSLAPTTTTTTLRGHTSLNLGVNYIHTLAATANEAVFRLFRNDFFPSVGFRWVLRWEMGKWFVLVPLRGGNIIRNIFYW